MHLIKTARDMIYDLEYGRVYINNHNSIAMFDSPTSLGVSIAEDDYEEVERTWTHMSSLCQYDATVETPEPRKWKVGDTVWINTSTRAYEGKITGQNSDLWAVRLIDPPEGVDADNLCSENELSDIPF